MAKDKRYKIIAARVSADTLRELEKIATIEDRSISYLINKSVEEYIKIWNHLK